MKALIVCFSILICGQPLFSQTQALEIFAPLVGKTWKAESNWGDGSSFKQKVHFEYQLDSQIVIAHSEGYTNQEQTEFGPRNHGIRKYDPQAKVIKFWEFDVFGGLTEGTVQAEGKDIWYHYNYGGTAMSECWAYQNDSTWLFTVGTRHRDAWQVKFLETSFHWVEPENHPTQLLDQLIGNWVSNAWDGQLFETWNRSDSGDYESIVHYVEQGDTTYQAKNSIEWIAGELHLISVIQGNPSKIFKATSWDMNSITFENLEYKNPSQVVYQFDQTSGFKRTISGIENDKPSRFTFDFASLKNETE